MFICGSGILSVDTVLQSSVTAEGKAARQSDCSGDAFGQADIAVSHSTDQPCSYVERPVQTKRKLCPIYLDNDCLVPTP